MPSEQAYMKIPVTLSQFPDIFRAETSWWGHYFYVVSIPRDYSYIK